MSRINWSTAAQGAQVVPVLLIHGMPVILYPDGVNVTSFSLTSPDAAWWPANTYANWTAYAKPWLMLDGDGVRITERAVPSAAQVLDVSEVTFRISDVDGAATALFDSESLAAATYITAEVSASTATIPVVNTAAFAASGVIYLDQEAIAYASKTSTSFTFCTRGRFGSKAARHLYSAAQGSGLGNPQVTSIPVEYIGRPATLWLARIANGVLLDVQLEHFGTVGTGPALTGGGESEDDAWVITVDHAIKRMAQTIHANAVSVGGYAHPGNLAGRATGVAPADDDLTPFYLRMAVDSASAVYANILTGDAASPDNGGWHPTRESFIAALNSAGSGLGVGDFNASINDAGRFSVRFASQPTVARFYRASAPCTSSGGVTSEVAANTFIYDFGQMAEAWVPIMSGSPVYLSSVDYATIPAPPSSSLASYALVFGDDRDRSSRRVARITGQGTSGGVSFVTCTALTTAATVRGATTGSSGTTAPDGTALWRGGFYGAGFILTEATTARLALVVSSSSWVTALQTVVESLDTEYACVADAIDFTRIAEVADAYPSVIPSRREYIVDLNTSILSMLQNEAALNGFAVTMYRGRVAIARVAEFATTETTQGTITSADLDEAAPVPTYERGADGIVNTFTIVDVDAGVTVNVTDRTSHARFGGQGTITATMPRSVLDAPRDASRLYSQVFAQAALVLGPLRYPYRHVTVQLPLNHYDLQVGDLARVTLWRVPNGAGGRGIVDAVAQIIAREVVLYGDASAGHVAYTLRLNPSNVSGYAPSGLVAAGGISGAVVTLDVATIPNGFSGTGDDAATFAVGDLVRLVEIDTASPTASTQHAVTAVGTNTVTLNPAPSAGFVALAASALKVLVVYDDWTVLTAGNRTEQERYCFLAQADGTLDATHGARVFAA